MTTTYYYKILRRDLLHRSFQYKLGLNVDTKYRGLHFTTLQHLDLYTNYGDLVGEIEIPADACVYHEPPCHFKSKTDKLILKSLTSKEEFYITSNFFKLIPPDALTPEMCETAVKHNPMLFYFVPDRFKTSAVSRNPWGGGN
jgi:hypothetical protein